MRIVALMIFLIMITSTLAGCTGDNNELNSANDRIAELEAQNNANQNLIYELESEAISDEELYQKLMNDFSNQSTLISELQNNCCTWDDMYEEWYLGWNEGYIMGVEEANPVSTLDIIVDRGSMKCGVKSNQYGMGYLDSISGNWSGLDITYCRAVAAAIGLNPDMDIEYVLSLIHI